MKCTASEMFALQLPAWINDLEDLVLFAISPILSSRQRCLVNAILGEVLMLEVEDKWGPIHVPLYYMPSTSRGKVLLTGLGFMTTWRS